MSSETKKGDECELKNVPKGGPPTTPDEPESVRQKALAEEIMRDDRDVLHELAE